MMNRVFVYIENGELKHISSYSPDELITTVVTRNDDVLEMEEIYDVQEASFSTIMEWVREVKAEIAARGILDRRKYMRRLREQVDGE